MMKTTLMFITVLLLLTSSCQKRKYPEENVQAKNQDIYVNGLIDDMPVDLTIGSNGYYCYSSYSQSSDSIYLFKGELKKFDCNPCPMAIQVILSDCKKRSPGSSIPPDSVLITGKRSFLPAVSMINKVRFAAYANKEIASLKWITSDGISFQDSVISYEYRKPGVQTVSLTIKTTGNCESMVVNKIFIDNESGLFACSIKTETITNNTSTFQSTIIGGRAPFKYSWNFGDGNTGDQASTSHSYKYSGSYPVKLRVVDADNHLCESNYIYVAGNDKSSCSANMSLAYEGSRAGFLNGAKLRWTDASNVVFSSDAIIQPAESYFEVLSSRAYEANERGETGRLLTLRFNILLTDGTRNSWFKSDNAAIAVTYK